MMSEKTIILVAKIIALPILIAVYVIMGVTVESLEMITDPAYWSLYGVAWGGLFFATATA